MSATRRQVLGWGALAAGGLALAACSSQGAQPAPSPSDTGSVTNAETLAELVLWTAQRGADAGSYGIGGALVENATGRVLQTMPNRVFRTLKEGGTFVEDPTAHGERQLMSWYLSRREALGLIDPGGLTVVTSLDPCLMCASSLLTVGVNVGVIAIDDYSGVNYDSSGTFADLPASLRPQAGATFGYYAVDGGRAFQGSRSIVYADQTITQDTLGSCANLYSTSADQVRSARRESGTNPSKLMNPATNPAGIDIVRAYQVGYDEAFSISLKDPRKPDRRIYDALVDLVRSTPGATNAVAFIDPFGNLVTAQADQQEINALSTAFALCTRAYAETRYALVDSPATSSLAAESLTNPTYGTFVWLTAPNPFEPTGMFDYGAYGSTMGSATQPTVPSAFQYFELPPGVSERELQDVVYPLPPLYSQGIKISPQRVVGVA
ncbi:MAG: cytosine/adenosine deaminase [Actinomycetota bacterium]|jgi:cytosine deaminase